MPYKDSEQRKLAARKWRLLHRAERAAYMRRYRKAKSSGRRRGRPRSRTAPSAPRSSELGLRPMLLPASEATASIVPVRAEDAEETAPSPGRVLPVGPGDEGTPVARQDAIPPGSAAMMSGPPAHDGFGIP